MINSRRKILHAIMYCVAVFPSAVSSANSADANQTDSYTIVVNFSNRTEALESEVLLAQAQCSRIFAAINVHIQWGDVNEKNATSEEVFYVVIRLSPYKLIENRPNTSDILGMAFPDTRVAFIFSDQVKRFGDCTHLEGCSLLGIVIAHEIGHLVLPGSRHTTQGVMAKSLDSKQTKEPRFTPKEAKAIRLFLKSSEKRKAPHAVW